MSDPAHLNDEAREELVAFLDGELTEDDAHKVEAKLNTDPKVRAEADALRRTWDLLDYLPKPEPSPNFTIRTMERVGPVRKTQLVSRPRGRMRVVVLGLVWAASLLLALGAGYSGMSLFLKRGPSDRDLVRDLRLIENKHLYEVGDDLEFLRELDRPDLFGDETLGS
jgi:anti-sigma factor RsiW